MIDLARYLMGKPKVVSAVGATYDKVGIRSNVKGVSWWKSMDYDDYNDVEDIAVGFVRFDNGATLSCGEQLDPAHQRKQTLPGIVRARQVCRWSLNWKFTLKKTITSQISNPRSILTAALFSGIFRAANRTLRHRLLSQRHTLPEPIRGMV